MENQYKIKYGDTLSGIALKNNTTVNELMKLNPNITNPNKIYADTAINITPKEDWTVVNSNGVRKEYAKNVSMFDNAVNAKANANDMLYNQPKTMPDVTSSVNNNTIAPDDIDSTVKEFARKGYTVDDIYNNLNKTVDIGTISNAFNKNVRLDPNAYNEYDLAKRQRDLVTNSEKFYQDYKTSLDTIRATATRDQQILIDGIKNSYAQKKLEVEKAYQGLSDTREKWGYQTEGFKYTGKQMDGIITNDDTNRLMKLQELKSQEDELLSKAMSAKTDGDIKGLNELADRYDKKSKEISDTLLEMSKAAIEATKLASKQNSIADTTADRLRTIENSSSAWLDQYNKLGDDISKNNFINLKAKELNVSPDIIRSSLSNREYINKKEAKSLEVKPVATKAKTTSKKVTFKDIDFKTDFKFIDKTDYLTPESFNKIMQEAVVDYSITRKDVLTSLLSSGLIDRKNLKKYNLTEAEIKTLQ
jgi:LysM repeat protein